MSATKYPLPMKLMHWTMSILIICVLIVGFLMTGWWSDKPFTGDLFYWHKSFGVLLLLLAIWRVSLRYKYRNDVPPLAPTMPWYERTLAEIVYMMMYACIFIMPIAGFLTSSFHPKSPGVPFFFFYFPQIFPKNQYLADLFANIHLIFAYTLLVCLILHVSGVIRHRFFDKPEHDSLTKML